MSQIITNILPGPGRMPFNRREFLNGHDIYMRTYNERRTLLLKIKKEIKRRCRMIKKKGVKRDSEEARDLDKLHEMFYTTCKMYYWDLFCIDVEHNGKIEPGYIYESNVGELAKVFFVYQKGKRWFAGVKKMKIPEISYPYPDSDPESDESI